MVPFETFLPVWLSVSAFTLEQVIDCLLGNKKTIISSQINAKWAIHAYTSSTISLVLYAMHVPKQKIPGIFL